MHKQPKPIKRGYIPLKKRHGLRVECKKCHTRKNIGGVRSNRKIGKILYEIIQEHKGHQDQLTIHRDYHATALPSSFAERTTVLTDTGNTDWHDVVTLASGSFTTGRKYLIIVSSQLKGSSSAGEFGMRLEHGTTVFPGSFLDMEPQGIDSTSFYTYAWFTVWTAIASQGLQLQHQTKSSSQTVSSNTAVILSIEISEDLVENTDWHFDSRIASDTLGTSFTTTNAGVTFTPNGTDDWLILCTADLRPVDLTIRYATRLNRDDTDLTPLWKQEGEDADNRMIQTFMRVFTPSAASHTFESESANFGGASGTREYSSIFALNLNKFKVHNDNYTDGIKALGTTAFADEIQTTTIQPDITGDVVILGSWIADEVEDAVNSRLQVDNADQPANQTSNAYLKQEPWDVDDQLGLFHATIENLDTTSHTLDIDGSASAGAADAIQRQLVAFTLELEAVAQRPEGAAMVNTSAII